MKHLNPKGSELRVYNKF
uniref:Uncharacterized protein n=1 Tax=Rhizophora mucronata TaxID=61149 RepID=A0A2P2J3L5_RHIMU